MKRSVISVIIPLKSLSPYLLGENLPAFLSQSYKHFEVLVLPNTKSSLDAALKKQYPFLRIIHTGKKSRPAEKRDIGVKYAKGNILAFIDDDAFPQKKWLACAVKDFEIKNVGAVCGPGLLPKSAQFWEQVFDEVLKTSIGSGGFAYRFVNKNARYVDDYPSMNFLIKKKLFNKLGGFNSEYWPGEDSKLCEDLVYKLGEKIYYDPNVAIYHHRRTDLQGYLQQHGNYGFHRGAFFAHGDRNSRRVTYLIPTIFVLYLCLLLPVILSVSQTCLPAGRESRFLFFGPLLLYFILLISLAISAFKNMKSLKIALTSAIVLFLTHIVYGVMFVKGFIVGMVRKERIYA